MVSVLEYEVVKVKGIRILMGMSRMEMDSRGVFLTGKEDEVGMKKGFIFRVENLHCIPAYQV